MQVSIRADRVIHQTGESLGELDGCTIEEVDDATWHHIATALAEPNGGVTLSADHQTVTALPVPPPPEPDPAVVAAEQQRAADAQTLHDALTTMGLPDAAAALLRILNPTPAP